MAVRSPVCAAAMESARRKWLWVASCAGPSPKTFVERERISLSLSLSLCMQSLASPSMVSVDTLKVSASLFSEDNRVTGVARVPEWASSQDNSVTGTDILLHSFFFLVAGRCGL